MTIDRDDPERERSSAPDAPAGKLHGFESDRDLAAWALAYVRNSLLQDGVPAYAIRPIVTEALRDYANFRKAVPDPRAFLVERILTKGRRYKTLRGIGQSSDAEDQRPHPLEVVRTKEAVNTLGPDARRVILMLFHEDKTFEEMAAELDTTVVYVQRVVQKAMQQLRAWRPQAPRES